MSLSMPLYVSLIIMRSVSYLLSLVVRCLVLCHLILESSTSNAKLACAPTPSAIYPGLSLMKLRA